MEMILDELQRCVCALVESIWDDVAALYEWSVGEEGQNVKPHHVTVGWQISLSVL